MRADIVFGSTFLPSTSPPSAPVLASNRHSARGTRVPKSRDFVPWRFSDAAGRSEWQGCRLRRQRNLHTSRLMHRNKCSLFDHLVGE